MESPLEVEGEVIRPDIICRTINGKEIWIECETCKNLEDPLLNVKDKCYRILEFKGYYPDEIWLVFPYRKLFTYGPKRLKEFKGLFKEFAEKRGLKDKLRCKVFLTDFYEEKLREL